MKRLWSGAEDLWVVYENDYYPLTVYRRQAELLGMLGRWDRAGEIHRINLECLERRGFRYQAAASR